MKFMAVTAASAGDCLLRLCPRSCRTLCLKQNRQMGRSAEAHALATSQSEEPMRLTFEKLGIRPPIAAALHASFPNVKFPTESQCRFIPALLGGMDVLLKDDTGTGKSFGLILALLSKPRRLRQDPKTGKTSKKPSITSLVIVPHRDLAYQLLHWIKKITASATVTSPPPISLVAQMLVRDNTPLSSRISVLNAEPPHILIGTPQALLDVWNEDRDALQIASLSTVIVDEVDYLVDSVPITRNQNKKMMEWAKRKIDRHPSATRQLLNKIYASQIQANQQADDEPAYHPRRNRPTQPPSETPQLVMSSATLRNHLKIYLYSESGWLKKDRIVKVVGPPPSKRDAQLLRNVDHGEETDGLGGTKLSHCALVVSRDGDIKNIDGAIPAQEAASISTTEDKGAITPEALFESPEVPDGPTIDRELEQKFADTPWPFNPNTFEAIATAFALDVPSVAILVLPSSAPVQRAIYELRGLGVNAKGLDLMADDKGRAHLLCGGAETVHENPILLVSTLATTRGLDLPELTHVFILGIPDGRAADGRTLDSYLHLAGRVGRFGRGGKVITVVEKEGEKDEGIRMGKIYKELRIKPVIFEHFH